jgi:hypothetical protein
MRLPRLCKVPGPTHSEKGQWFDQPPSREPYRDQIFFWVYYETIKWELNRRLIYEWRCDERLKGKVEGSTWLVYTRLREGLEQLKIETKLINERFPSTEYDGWVCDLDTTGDPSIFKIVRSDTVLFLSDTLHPIISPFQFQLGGEHHVEVEPPTPGNSLYYESR